MSLTSDKRELAILVQKQGHFIVAFINYYKFQSSLRMEGFADLSLHHSNAYMTYDYTVTTYKDMNSTYAAIYMY